MRIEVRTVRTPGREPMFGWIEELVETAEQAVRLRNDPRIAWFRVHAVNHEKHPQPRRLRPHLVVPRGVSDRCGS
jgi:hypothetical protein